MKRMISILLTAAMIFAAALTLTGCSGDGVTIESVMDISSGFSGTRTVTVKFPLSVKIDEFKDAVIADDPTSDTDGVTFIYKGVEEDGYYFELGFEFGDNAEYEEQVSAVIGRQASSILSVKDTILTKGTRMSENFALRDLAAWIIRDAAAAEETKGLEFTEAGNTVSIDSQSFSTGPSIDINEVVGCTVNSVSINTSNDKEGHYDRTFVFSVPNDIYITFQESFEQYFLTNTAPASSYYGWKAEGSSMLYTVIYEALDIDELKEYTAMLLDTDDIEIYYGDRDNSSTPLSEGRVFEESLDTFSFIGPDKGAPKLSYTYSLPSSAIHGDGAVYTDGRWAAQGKWEEGVYRLEPDIGAIQLRVPDGVQYAINGIDFILESLGGERFRRTTSFLYSKTDGYDGMNYALGFFTAKGAVAYTEEDDDNLICSVVSEGTTAEITAELVSLFGSGNFMTCSRRAGAFALSEKTEFTDYISLGSMLNSSNANRPMRYRIRSSGGENIVSVSVDGSESAYISPAESELTVKGGNAAVSYRGNIPITSHIIIYVIAGSLLLAATILTAALMLRRRAGREKSRGAQEIIDSVVPEKDSEADPISLQQTTTFSIFELGALSRNKKVVDEINKDIEERLEAERLEEKKKEIRAKELEEMERKVYGGSDDDGDKDEQAEPVADDASKEPEKAEISEEDDDNWPIEFPSPESIPDVPAADVPVPEVLVPNEPLPDEGAVEASSACEHAESVNDAPAEDNEEDDDDKAGRL